MGLNGSRQLSPPAATVTPADMRSSTAVRPRGFRVLLSRPCRKRLVWGSATTAIPASAMSRAASRTTAESCMPRLTQCDAVTGRSKPEPTTSSASRRRTNVPASVVSSMCTSMPRPKSLAIAKSSARDASESPSSDGTPPTKSAPRSMLATMAALFPLPSLPPTSPASATICTSMTPFSCSRSATRARMPSVPISSRQSTWVRTAVNPWASASPNAFSPRRPISSPVMEGYASMMAVIAPAKSPETLVTRPPRRALSRWACGSTGAGNNT